MNNEFNGSIAGGEEEIPAEAFDAAAASAAALAAAVAADGAGAGASRRAGAAAGACSCSGVGATAEEAAGGRASWGVKEERKALDDENCMPPYRPPALLDISMRGGVVAVVVQGEELRRLLQTAPGRAAATN